MTFADNKAGVEPTISLVVMILNTYYSLACLIHYVIKAKIHFLCDNQGIISGSPHTDGELEENYRVPQAHLLGLLSSSLYEVSTKPTNCMVTKSKQKKLICFLQFTVSENKLQRDLL